MFYAYSKFESISKYGKFDIISIDAPFGYVDGTFGKYARRDIIGLLPGIVGENFVIVIDDYNRAGEQNTVKDIENIFEKSSIKTNKGIYEGSNKVCVITSDRYKFLCSM